MGDETLEGEKGFNERYANQLAECDGGGPIKGTRYAGRQEFSGRLTGDYLDVGDPPSRWYLMVDLQCKPESFLESGVWCLAGNTFLVESGRPLTRD